VYVPQNTQPVEDIPVAAGFSLPRAQPAYGGFWLRAAAYLIDTSILSLSLAVVGSFRPSAFIIFPDATSLTALPHLTPIAVGLTIPIVWLYYALCEASSWQATPGKRVLGLYVADLHGRPITFMRATIRHFAKIISSLTFLVGYILAGFTEKKQALHDMIASCLVLRRS
jgi:uncharacterized RDD family membrane protein YckC